jgi:hypothetical protein
MRLGFDAVGDEAFKAPVLARIASRTSKLAAIRVLEENAGPPHRNTFTGVSLILSSAGPSGSGQMRTLRHSAWQRRERPVAATNTNAFCSSRFIACEAVRPHMHPRIRVALVGSSGTEVAAR